MPFSCPKVYLRHVGSCFCTTTPPQPIWGFRLRLVLLLASAREAAMWTITLDLYVAHGYGRLFLRVSPARHSSSTLPHVRFARPFLAFPTLPHFLLSFLCYFDVAPSFLHFSRHRNVPFPTPFKSVFFLRFRTLAPRRLLPLLASRCFTFLLSSSFCFGAR